MDRASQYPALEKYLAACKKFRWVWNIRRPDWWSRWIFLALYLFAYFKIGLNALWLLPIGFAVEYLLAGLRLRTFGFRKMMTAQAEDLAPQNLASALASPKAGRSLDTEMLSLLDACAKDCYRISTVAAQALMFGDQTNRSTRAALREAAMVADKSMRRLIATAFRQYLGFSLSEGQLAECESARLNLLELADLCENSVRAESLRVDNEAITNSIAHLKAITELQEAPSLFPRA